MISPRSHCTTAQASDSPSLWHLLCAFCGALWHLGDFRGEVSSGSPTSEPNCFKDKKEGTIGRRYNKIFSFLLSSKVEINYYVVYLFYGQK